VEHVGGTTCVREAACTLQLRADCRFHSGAWEMAATPTAIPKQFHPKGSELASVGCTWLSREPEMKSDGWLGCGATAVIMSRCPCIQHSTGLAAAGLSASPEHFLDRMLPCRLLQKH
jgi:hypothetical protein